MTAEKKKRVLSGKQAKAAKLIRDRTTAGEPLTEKLLADADDEAYTLDGDRKKAGKNLKRAEFLSELGLDSRESRRTLSLVLWQCLHGEHPMYPKDKELMIPMAYQVR